MSRRLNAAAVAAMNDIDLRYSAARSMRTNRAAAPCLLFFYIPSVLQDARPFFAQSFAPRAWRIGSNEIVKL